MKREKKNISRTVYFTLFFLFVVLSFMLNYKPGIDVGKNFGEFSLEMIKILPPIFILIGLFEVWVKRETIVKHLGLNGGIMSYLWVFLLAAPMAGGILPSFPIAYSLYKKGARLTVILVFLRAVGVGRVPMILFESSFLGWKFSVIRIVASIPLVVVGSVILGKYLWKTNYEIPKKEI